MTGIAEYLQSEQAVKDVASLGPWIGRGGGRKGRFFLSRTRPDFWSKTGLELESFEMLWVSGWLCGGPPIGFLKEIVIESETSGVVLMSLFHGMELTTGASARRQGLAAHDSCRQKDIQGCDHGLSAPLSGRRNGPDPARVR